MLEKKLSNGNAIPMVGLGVFKSAEGDETVNAVKWAIESGYTHIDTAKVYGNEKSVGEGVKASGAKREDLFITTKLWNADVREGNTKDAFYKSLESLGMDYVDLYLIHWPVEGRVAAWLEMEKLYEEGLIKNIGISNFHKPHLDELLANCNIVPQINQIESHPRLQNTPLIEYCQSKGIAIEAWSPLGGGKTAADLLQDETLVALGKKYNKSAAQIIVRWDMQRDVIVLPKSVNKDRIVQNFDVCDFELSAEDMAAIKLLNKDMRVGSDPDNFNF